MAWSTIRQATPEDEARLEAATERFIQKYGEHPENFTYPRRDLQPWEQAQRRRLAKAWRGMVKRALREPAAEGIAYGYVGYHAD